MFIPLHYGFIIHERLAHASHRFCNRWDYRIFSTGCGCCQRQLKPTHWQNPIGIQKIGKTNENRIFLQKDDADCNKLASFFSVLNHVYCGFIIHECLAHAPHWCYNCWNCRIFQLAAVAANGNPNRRTGRILLEYRRLGKPTEIAFCYKKTMPTVTNWHRFSVLHHVYSPVS